MEAVNVFVGVDCFEESFGVDVAGQRKLDEDAVDIVAVVEVVDQVQHLVGRDALGRCEQLAEDTEFATGFDLAADVDLRSGDFADEDYSKARLDAGGPQRLDLGGDLGFDL